MSMQAEELCNLRFFSLAGGHQHREIVDAAPGGVDLRAIDVLEDYRCNGVYIEEGDHGHLVCQTFQIVAELLVDLVQRSAKLLLTGLVADRGYQQRIAIGRQLEWRIRGDVQQLQNRLVDDQCQAVAVLDQCLCHDDFFRKAVYTPYIPQI